MKFNLKNRPTEVFELTKESMFQKLCEWIRWAEGLETEIRRILELAENQIKVLKEDLKLHKKPKRKPTEYERIECSISRWQHTKLLCLEILGEKQE